MTTSGIYKITNMINGKCYIGSAINIKKRWEQHRRQLNNGKHHSVYLQSSWAKHGEAAFKFETIEVVAKQHLLAFEQVYLDLFFSYERSRGYNICVTAGSQLGMKRSDESKAKMSLAGVGRVTSDEIKLKISKAITGKSVSDKTRAKMSAVKIGNKHGLGHRVTDEARTQLRNARIHTGKGYCFSKKYLRWRGRILTSSGKIIWKVFRTEAEAAEWISKVRDIDSSTNKQSISIVEKI